MTTLRDLIESPPLLAAREPTQLELSALDEVRRLPSRFRHAGWNYRVLRRQGDIVLLEQTKPSVSTPSYEVARLRVRPARMLGGRLLPAAEAMPRSEEWGTRGWTFTRLGDAQRKFGALCDQKAPL